MVKMTDKEKELLKKLTAKKRAEAQREREFWRMIDERENEVITYIKAKHQRRQLTLAVAPQ